MFSPSETTSTSARVERKSLAMWKEVKPAGREAGGTKPLVTGSSRSQLSGGSLRSVMLGSLASGAGSATAAAFTTAVLWTGRRPSGLPSRASSKESRLSAARSIVISRPSFSPLAPCEASPPGLQVLV